MSTAQPPLKKMRYTDGDGDGDGEVHLDEGVVGEILLRLPAASLLRCRAVCTAWRRLADSPEFIAARARHRPVEILLYTRYEVGPDGLRRKAIYGGGDEVDLDALAVVPAGVHGRRRLARYPVVDKNPEYLPRPYCSLVASCDGLLLLGQGGRSGLRPYDSYLVCNPATRQWTQLPPPTAAGEQPLGIVPASLELRESGFYHHAPSGEYRLLCHVTPLGGVAQAPPYYCVLSAGALEPRRLTAPATPMEQTMAVVPGSGPPPKLKPRYWENLMTPAALGGRLHWLRHMEAGLTDSMVAFDTAAETFRRMPPPPPVATSKGPDTRLLVADGDTPTLMAAELGDLVLDLWALEGYTGVGEEETTARWVLRHRVEVPWPAWRSSVVAGDGSGDVVLGSKDGVVAYNVRSRAARRVVIDDEIPLLSRHVLRESLVRHRFFDALPHPGLTLFDA